MYRPRPYFQFSFPKDDVIDSFFANVQNIYSFYEMLKQMWQGDEYFSRFKWPIKLNTEKSGNYVLIRCVKRCRFMVKLTRINVENQITFKIDVFNNTHNHFFMEYTQTYRQKTGERGLQIKSSPNQRLIDSLHTPKSKLYGEIPRSKNPFEQAMRKAIFRQNKKQMDNRQSFEQPAQLFRIHDFFKRKQEQLKKRKKQLKQQIIQNALVKFEQQEDGSKSFVFYSSNTMGENFKKWGKSIVVMSVKCLQPKVPQYFLKPVIGIKKKSEALIFCGCNNEMQIAIFAIAVITVKRRIKQDEYYDYKKMVIQNFLDFPSSKNIQTVILYQHEKQLIDIFQGFKKTKLTCTYLIKLKLQKFYNVYKSSQKQNYHENTGIIFKLAYNNLFENRFPHLRNQVKYYNSTILKQRPKTKTKKRQYGFIGLNLLVNFQEWLNDLICRYSLDEKIAQTLVRQRSNLQQNPKTCSQLFFREILLMLNQGKFLFDPPEERFWENIGFNVYQNQEQIQINESDEESDNPTFYDPKNLPSKINLKSDWQRQIIRYSSSISVKYQITSKYSKMLDKLPYYKMSLVHLSKAAHQLIMTYQLMQMLKYNCSQEQLYLDNQFYEYNPNNNAFSGSSSCRTFIVGSQQEVFYVWKINNKKWKCSCVFKEYMGMPCRHILKAIIASDSRLSQSMLQFWKVQINQALPPIW